MVNEISIRAIVDKKNVVFSFDKLKTEFLSRSSILLKREMYIRLLSVMRYFPLSDWNETENEDEKITATGWMDWINEKMNFIDIDIVDSETIGVKGILWTTL